MIRQNRLNSTKVLIRRKVILSGLYLSKYDSLGLKALGFDSFGEAFNAIGYGLGARPASIKNYRDEFDPLFPNERKGWHKRPTRDYCLKIFEEYGGLDLKSFTEMVKSFFVRDDVEWRDSTPTQESENGSSSFAQRLITGLAAEQYFESVHTHLAEFKGYRAENTTRFGCGYDFRLHHEMAASDFICVEVKGLKEQTGSLSMTPKEYEVAAKLRDRFFLFIVRNFRESPSHSIYKDPLSSGLQFRKVERVLVQVSWLTSV